MMRLCQHKAHSKMAQLAYRGKLYIVAESEFHDPTWSATDRKLFMMALAVQNPSTRAAYDEAIHVARMWIYEKRGCKYPAWSTRLQKIDSMMH